MWRWTKRILVALVILCCIGIVVGYTPDTDRAAMRKKYTNAESEFITIAPGLNVHLRDEGVPNGPALVLIHGSNSSLHTWEGWVKQLKDRYRIISIDLPGHGLTGADPKGDYSNARYVDVVNRILMARKIDSAIIAGNSMGGNVAWQFALAQPGKTAALVLLDASGPPVKTDKPAPIGFRLMRMPGVRDLARVISPRSIFESSAKGSYFDPKKVTPAIVDRYWELNRFPGNRDATVWRFSQFAKQKPAELSQLATIKAPTLILWGKQDGVLPVAGADWFAKAIPGSTKIVYDQVGHLPMEEIPDKSAADMRMWLSTEKL